MSLCLMFSDCFLIVFLMFNEFSMDMDTGHCDCPLELELETPQLTVLPY